VQFTKGVSGNPSGRPRGIKDKRHRYAESIDSMIPQVLESVYQKALAGDMTAARMLLDRTLPNKRPEQERIGIQHSGNIALDTQNVLRGVLDGEVSPDVGATLLSAMTSVLKAIEVEELTKRIDALESTKNEPANA
jgi:hypothetical protein